MSRSNTYTFSVTRDELIADALIQIGALDPEAGTPTATQITKAALVLNMMVKSWHSPANHLWTRRMVPVTLTGASSYNLGAANSTVRPLRIISGYIRNTSNTDTPITVISREEYNLFGNKASTGTTVNVYYDPLLDTGIIYTYPISSTGTLFLNCEYPLMDFTVSGDSPDFPQEWYNALRWNLAKELALGYGVSSVRFGTIKNEAKEALDSVLGFDTESPASFYFSPM